MQGRFGTVLVRVTHVEPESVKPFEEVAAEVRREIAVERAKNAIDDVHDKVEDQRAGARPLPQIARENGPSVMSIPAIDRSGKDKAGRPIANLPEREAVLAAAFGSDVGVDNEALRTKDGGYVWFEVAGIEPARDKTLAETKAAVASSGAPTRRRGALPTGARALATRLDSGEAIEAVAADAGCAGEDRDRSRQARRQGRALGRGRQPHLLGAGRQVGERRRRQRQPGGVQGHGRDGAALRDDAQEAAAIADQMRLFLSDDLIAEYVRQAQQDLGVKVNQDALRRAVSGSES